MMKVYDSSVQHIVELKSTRHWILNDREPDSKDKNKIKDQFTSFQKAMKVLIVWGQCLGLNPVTGILQNDVSKMRFTVCSWKFLFSITLGMVQIIGTGLSLYRLLRGSVSITSLAFLTFFISTCCTIFAFIRIAKKWPTVMKELLDSKLDEYIDPTIIKKCNIACISFIGMAVMEHTLSILAKVAKVFDCSGNVTDYGEEYFKLASPWFYEMNVPYVQGLGVLIQYVTLTATATWNYTDMFLVCMSLYLTSIFKQINKKIALAVNKNYMPTSIWGELREDYTRATRLVRLFDDVFSSIILVTFASDLFFICLQLFNILASIPKSVQLFKVKCPAYPSSLFLGYEYPVYLSYSTLYLFTRFLTVSLVAAGVNTASMEPAPLLYRIPTSAYTKEVERFLNQVNDDVVALSGMRFFYITKELVLSVAGTIVTYELVLLQFGGELM